MPKTAADRLDHTIAQLGKANTKKWLAQQYEWYMRINHFTPPWLDDMIALFEQKYGEKVR